MTTTRKMYTNSTSRDLESSNMQTSLPRPKFKTILCSLLSDSHMILSIYQKSLRPFPRYVRISLLYVLLFLQAFLACISVSIWEKSSKDLFFQLVISV